jgi:hypothetical protein
MCDICDIALKQPLQAALATIAQAMQQRKNRGLTCLDDAVGTLAGSKTGQDALDQETESLENVP